MISRRNALSGALVVGIGVPTLAACGNDEPDEAAAGSVLASAGDVPVGSGIIANGIVVTQPEAGTFKGFGVTCTHQGCPVSTVDETINCPCHGSKFSIKDGSVVHGPATSGLSTRDVVIEEGKVKLG